MPGSPRPPRASGTPSSSAGLLAALATVVLWASAFPTIRVALADFEPVPLASLRFTIASVPMLIWCAVRRPTLPAPRHLLLFLACGAIGIALYNVALNTGQRTVSGDKQDETARQTG